MRQYIEIEFSDDDSYMCVYRNVHESPSIEDTVSFTRVSVSIDDIVRSLHDCQLKMGLTGIRPRYLLVGKSEMRDILNMPEVEHMFSFHVPKEDINARIKPEVAIFGVTVVLVPWIEGIFCMPEIEHWCK